jgi:phosphoglycerate dehydrogenase-like enzyme
MSTVLIKTPVSSEEASYLQQEFPQCRFLFDASEAIASDRCSLVEVIYGDTLTADELKNLTYLHWIHTPTPYIDQLCIQQIQDLGNVIITKTPEENLHQMGEYAMGCISAFGKSLFQWKELVGKAVNGSLNPLKESMWTFEGKTFIQIGLSDIGTTIAHQAKRNGFRVFGINDPPSFHPACEKVMGLKELNSRLPSADVVCLVSPRDQPSVPWFKAKELSLMKNDSILLVFGSGSAIDINALEVPSLIQKFRGVAIDAYFSRPIRSDSILWTQSNVILTPEVSGYPKKNKGYGFITFIRNMREYLRGNFEDMSNVT